jgi:hypothetical protein
VNTRGIANIVLIFRICGVKVSKIHVEREGGVGSWWVMPFSEDVQISKPSAFVFVGLLEEEDPLALAIFARFLR